MSNHSHEQLAAILARPDYGIVGDDRPAVNASEAIRVEDWSETTAVRHDLQSPLFNQILGGFCQQWGFADDLVFEHKFHPQRKWRFDAAIPSIMVAIELEGGTWARKGAKKCRVCGQTPQGRHTTGTGYGSDIEKYNTAALMGWFVLRFTSDMVRDGRMLATLEMLPPF